VNFFQIGDNLIEHNLFTHLKSEFMDVDDKEDDYSSNFVKNNFKAVNNSILSPCQCNMMTNPNDDDEDDSNKQILFEIIKNSSFCFTKHRYITYGKVCI
jgi:hypothetical protein